MPFRAALREAVRKWRPHVAQLEFTQMAQYARDCAPARTILVEHDITFTLYAQLADFNSKPQTRKDFECWLEFERSALQCSSQVWTMHSGLKSWGSSSGLVGSMVHGMRGIGSSSTGPRAPVPRTPRSYGRLLHFPVGKRQPPRRWRPHGQKLPPPHG